MSEPVVIEKASELGFCCGVRRAISLLRREASARGQIQTLGPVVHNQQVVDALSHECIQAVPDISSLGDRPVAITAHGTDPETLRRLQERGLEIIDTTCTIVKAAQKGAARLAKAGFGVLIFGDPRHPEVKGLLGWSGEGSIATTDAADIRAWKEVPTRLGIISQTTQTTANFQRFLQEAVSAVLDRVREIYVINTSCSVTHDRQESTRELAARSDMMIVVGGRNSANTKRLAEISSAHTETHAIETAHELDPGWAAGKRHIGVTAGTSTPDDVIEAVVDRLRRLTGPG